MPNFEGFGFKVGLLIILLGIYICSQLHSKMIKFQGFKPPFLVGVGINVFYLPPKRGANLETKLLEFRVGSCGVLSFESHFT